MTTRLSTLHGVRQAKRLLIVFPVADLYSGIGNFGAPPLVWRLVHYLRDNGQHVDAWDSNTSTSLVLPSPDSHKGRDRAEVLAEAFVAAIETDYNLASYDFIGFSILSDTLPSTLGVIELIRKKYPKAILLGGNHEATVNLNDCVGKSQLNAVILADAEEPLLALMQGVEPSKIPGVLWRTFNPQPRREQFESWNRSIKWGEIPYKAYWDRTKQLYDWSAMTNEERLAKLYEVHCIRIHTIVACQLACTYSVVGDTRIFTKDGPVEIGKLAQGIGSVRACVHGVPVTEYRLGVDVATPAGRSIATHLVDEGVRPVLQITTEGGFSIKATPEHRFLCAVDDTIAWRSADELKNGDFVVIRKPEHKWPLQYQALSPPELSKWSRDRLLTHDGRRCPEVLDEKLAWLVGYIVGDGSIPRDGRGAFFMIVSPDLEAKQREIVREVFGLDLKVYSFKHTTKVSSGWAHSRLAREVLVQSIGVDPNDKLKIPAIFWKSPKAVLAAFVDGLFDADGYASNRRGERERYLTTVSERLARDVATAMLMLGRGCPNVVRVVPENYDGMNRQPHYRVSIFQNDRIPSTRSVYKSAFSGLWYWRTVKQKSEANNGCIGVRRSLLRKSGLHHPLDRDGWFYMRVRSIEQCLPEPIFDIAVPGEEAFVANGFVAHNCSVATTRRIAAGSMKPTITNLSTSALEENLLAIKAQVPDVMTIYDSSDEAWLGRGRAEEYLATLERVKPVMDAGLPHGMRWLIQCRSQDLDEEIIDRAAKVGVKHLTIGVESPVERVRKSIKKPQKEELVRNIAKWCTERGINAYMLFIMFLPDITLEELHTAVEHWRIYMALGATISVEPFCMAYLGTSLHDDASLFVEHAGYEIPFSGGKRLKWATLIWPKDHRVCAVLQWFRENVDAYIDAALKKLGHRHAFKGMTGRVTVDCLEEALRIYAAGQIAPWQPGGEGRRSAVYQDYGDQLSGAEIARAASSMDRRNTTATRFNSTHSLLDDTNAGVKGRVKDPALPHEFPPKPIE